MMLVLSEVNLLQPNLNKNFVLINLANYVHF